MAGGELSDDGVRRTQHAAAALEGRQIRRRFGFVEMTGSRIMKVLMLWTIALTACGSADGKSGNNIASDAGEIPESYIRAFTCDFDENPIAARERYHKTPAGRAARTSDLRVLRSLGFDRKGREGDLASLGGKIAAPPGLTILGLPVRSLGINGMIGDANSMYVTTFAKGVAVDQVVRAARLKLDRESYSKYKIRHYSRHIGDAPYTDMFLDVERNGDAVLVCQVQSTPD